MALRTKRWLRLDPIVWARMPAGKDLQSMPPHLAKEGALLAMEAGAPAFPALVRMADRPSAYTMDHANEFSERRAEDRQRKAAAEKRATRQKAGKPEPDAKDVQVAGVYVRTRNSLAAQLLRYLAERGGRANFPKLVRDFYFDGRPARDMWVSLQSLEVAGLIVKETVGTRKEPSFWALTAMGRTNADALMGGDNAENA